MTKEEKIKYLLIPASGFGIGGGLSSWMMLHFLSEGKTNNFVMILGATIFGLFSSISLVLLFKNINNARKSAFIFLGILFWIIIFYIAFWGIIFAVEVLPLIILLIFLLIVTLSGLFYGLMLKIFLKTQFWPVFWRVVAGFLFGPFIVVLATTLVSIKAFSVGIYFIFILLPGIIFGLCVGWGIYKGQKIDLDKTRQILQKT